MSFTLLSAYLTVELAFIIAHREAAEIERRNAQVSEAIAAAVNQDEFWKATLWSIPSTGWL